MQEKLVAVNVAMNWNAVQTKIDGAERQDERFVWVARTAEEVMTHYMCCDHLPVKKNTNK
eukprot:scaffold15459_cov49-Cyclotella_meneghiniana.AAC.4